MPSNKLSRRDIIAASAAIATALPLGAQPGSSKTITAGEVIARINNNVGIPWREQTVDNIIAGTLDVMKRAAAAGKNMAITHEPTFYSHQDTIDQLKDDPVYRYKTDFIREHNMVSFHFHDHWHRRTPDGIALGMAREIGWEKYSDPNNLRQFTIPETPLAKLAKDIESRLSARTIRVLGDPQLPVNRVNASWGYISQFPGITLAARQDSDLFICGETREWEVVEYVQDMISSGRRKGLIVIGHVLSEQAGMKYCAEWLRTFIPEVPVDFVPAREPFWAPDAPASEA